MNSSLEVHLHPRDVAVFDHEDKRTLRKPVFSVRDVPNSAHCAVLLLRGYKAAKFKVSLKIFDDAGKQISP